MATIITDLKESFRRGNIYITADLYQCRGLCPDYTDRSYIAIIQPEPWRNVRMAGAAGFAFPLHCTALVYPDLYVYACRSIAHPFQHALLYWFGALFLNFFSAKHLRGVYILGGICGGILYMAAYNIFPYFQPMTEYSFMLGASASVLAIVAATAYREPNYPIRLFLFGTIRLKYLALIVVGMDLLFITSSNAGGHIAI